ncbi:hypothetical protein C8Q78DRAFT_1074519 [Trametes maxima]|nr:hypothetical protein C8Q78DRAFT_1074519 [Trametes maxima]
MANPSSLLDELLREDALHLSDIFEHISSIPFECSAIEHPPPTPESQVLGDHVDWASVFARTTSVPLPSSPSTVFSDAAGPLTPVSDVTCFNEFLPSGTDDDSWMVPDGSSDGPLRFSQAHSADDPLKEFTFAYEYDAQPSLMQLATAIWSPDDNSTSSTGSASPKPSEREPGIIEDINADEPQKRAVKRRRRQDTTPRHKCEDCGNLFARKHNLVVHASTKHGGERPFVCKEPGCGHAFGRKHDLGRHHQSKHTTLGSPRHKPARQ